MGTYIFTAKVKNAQQLKKLPGYIAALLLICDKYINIHCKGNEYVVDIIEFI